MEGYFFIVFQQICQRFGFFQLSQPKHVLTFILVRPTSRHGYEPISHSCGWIGPSLLMTHDTDRSQLVVVADNNLFVIVMIHSNTTIAVMFGQIHGKRGVVRNGFHLSRVFLGEVIVKAARPFINISLEERLIRPFGKLPQNRSAVVEMNYGCETSVEMRWLARKDRPWSSLDTSQFGQPANALASGSPHFCRGSGQWRRHEIINAGQG
mmetsp:Transcript_16635/g.34314  ORF Transcript_16635/g.34314 Transcript_16635/m.34314 type:complete len:209 (+) Transcript_16635:1116-1742(+)